MKVVLFAAILALHSFYEGCGQITPEIDEELRIIVLDTTSDTLTFSWDTNRINDTVNETQVWYSISNLALNEIGNDKDENWDIITIKKAKKRNFTITDLVPNQGYDVKILFRLATTGQEIFTERVHLKTAIRVPLVEGLLVGPNPNTGEMQLQWNLIESSDLRSVRYHVEKRNKSSPENQDRQRTYVGDWEPVQDPGTFVDGYWKFDDTLIDGSYYEFTVYANTSRERGDSAAPTKLHRYEKPNSGTSSLYIGIIVPSVVTAFALVIAYCYYINRRMKKRLIKVPPAISFRDTDWELIRLRGLTAETRVSLPTIPRDYFTLGTRLGAGAFGEVYQAQITDGEHRGRQVAVKTLKEGAKPEEEQDLLKEAYFMHKLEHDNIIKMIGVCWNPFYLLLELMDGDLRNYLHSSRRRSPPNRRGSISPDGRSKLSLLDLLNIGLDVASGCRYLESQKFIHRDLAARNCLISMRGRGETAGPGIVVKIADFGLARNIYRQIYKKVDDGVLPIRWMAPESICDMEYTCKSDVWSYGVLLWEVMKLGEQPYPGMSNLQVLELVKRGGHPEQPLGTPDNIYYLMKECWNYEPDDRPTFVYICNQLTKFQENCSKIQPLSPTSLGRSTTIMDLLAPTSERIMLTGVANYAFTDDYGGAMTSDSSAKNQKTTTPSSSAEQQNVDYAQVACSSVRSNQTDMDD